ncbi:MAG: hypothetical protein RBR59_03970 [Sulfurimonadaceae bacterium]|jgi:acetyltransferase-like isoleucine patch superfamily enzyme|nr:hypothetical protein [Sulfurimonadaceae bacterium]
MYDRNFVYKKYKNIYFYIVRLYYSIFTNVNIGEKSRIEGSAIIYGNISIGNNVFIGKNVFISGNIIIGDNTSIYDFSKITTMKKSFMSIGSNCHIGMFNVIGSCSSLVIEDYVLFAAGVKITTGNHEITNNYNDKIRDTPFDCEPMVIGKNCWLGFDVNVIKGGQIGSNCVIGAKSVVNTKISSDSIAVGICAKVIKKREYIKKTYDDNFELQKKINILLKTINSIQGNVIIYGAGSVTNFLIPLIKDNVVGVVDKDPNKIGTAFEDIIVFHPKKLSTINFNKIFISVLGREDEIEAYLVNELKISNDKIVKVNLNDD